MGHREEDVVEVDVLTLTQTFTLVRALIRALARALALTEKKMLSRCASPCTRERVCDATISS